MKKTTKKTPKASHKKAKDLDVKPAKGGEVRGGPTAVEFKALGVRTSMSVTPKVY